MQLVPALSNPGDWSIHRGAAVFLDGVQNINITDCSFRQMGGNALMLSNYVRNCVIARNEFSEIGDSAIAALGSTQTEMMLSL